MENNEQKSREGWQPTRSLMIALAGALIVSLAAIAFLVGRTSNEAESKSATPPEATVTPTVEREVEAAVTVIEDGTSDSDAVQSAVRGYVGGAAADLTVETVFALKQGDVIVASIETNDSVFGNKWCWIERKGDHWEVADAAAPRSDFTVGDLVAEWPSASEKLIEQFLASVEVAKPVASAGQPTKTPSKVYTPGKGSAERTAILDACREKLEYGGLFKVHVLKVKRERAIATVEAAEMVTDPVTLYLEQIDGRWAVIYDELDAADSNKVWSEISKWLE